MTSDLSLKDNSKSEIGVSESESGQKLLNLLERHLGLPKSLLHRWIRSGQVRVNGKRSKPFDRVVTSDTVRLPPFACKLKSPKKALDNSDPLDLTLPKIVEKYQGLIGFSKPQGLPTHGGSGHTDSLAYRLSIFYRNQPFIPVPVHRLDKDTSGIIVVAETFKALQKAQKDLQAGLWQKEYVCWVHGKWPHTEPYLLENFLQKTYSANQEKMQVCVDDTSKARIAKTQVRPIFLTDKYSLLLVQIFTGRTHQIRVQLAFAGYPIVGDHKYGIIKDISQQLFLHSTRLTLGDGHQFVDLPNWPKAFKVFNLNTY